MLNNKKIMALIPARGGSKRLPRKNVLPLAGKPLINWTIEAGIQSQYVDRVFVSTDDKEIASIACELEVELPELRPTELASDIAKTEDVLLYSLDKFAPDVDIVVLLQPTSPLRNAKHIDEALEFFIKKNAFSVVSVTPCEHPPLWSNTLPKDNSMGSFIRSEALVRSQDISQYYRINGAIYIFDVKKLREYNEIRYTSESYAFEMSNEVSFDIDTEFDFELAQFFMKRAI
ncbi:acylneuraminate cytidylyltransferase family protein [Vibrio sp. T187]|uniref:acylneuraminate cytidylyltransferase family protein n=1 Tax=Vibrio TaxID=662 RepID=UPI0010C93E11|nr:MULTISPECIES: acylneuraminate cytidylyltransferase family protein [Vibrio]MBW3697596.1 acylneuraminate cytidylyltransferase family protein [Vibrio sp. T187]